MTSKTKTSTVVLPSYIDFEPHCELKEEDQVETLIVHLPDFKRDQLRVQVNNQGVLKVSGERTMDETHSSRFLKETKTPQGCDINQVRAKFTNGLLHVIMPKKVQSTPQLQQPAPPSSDAQQPLKSKVDHEPKAESSFHNEKEEPKAESSFHNEKEEPKAPSAETAKMGTTMACDDQPSDHMFGLRNSLARLQVGKKVTVSLGFAIFALVAIGAYAAYKHGSDSSATSSSSSSSSTNARIED